jgi:hypothetical protein
MSSSEAQKEAQMMAEPQKEHLWLQKLVGEWTVKSEAIMGPDLPPETWDGSESVRSLGGVWVLAEGRAEMPSGGGPMTSLITLGYDPAKKRFVGTFVASMMTFLWVYDGELDAEEKVLTLNAEGPDFTQPAKTAKYRDVIEFKSDDHRILSSHVLGDDGQWNQFMTAHYRRKS